MALVGQFNGEEPVLIGNKKELEFPEDGNFRLFVNDWEYKSNQGEVIITIVTKK